MRKLRVLLVVPLLALAACGGGANQAISFTESGGVLAAFESTTEAKTSRVDMLIEYSNIDGAPIDMNTSGVLNHETGDSQLEIAIPGLPEKMTLLIIGNEMFMKMPMVGGRHISEKPWLRMDLGAFNGSTGMDQSSPDSTLAMLKSNDGDVTEIGKEVVRGDQTTRYELTIDPVNMSAAELGVSEQELQQLRSMYGSTKFPAEVWVDEQNRFRKMTMTLDLANMPPATADVPMTGNAVLSMEFYDFGVEMNLIAPPADQVMEYATFAAQVNKADR